jgi:hypothetical protein
MAVAVVRARVAGLAFDVASVGQRHVGHVAIGREEVAVRRERALGRGGIGGQHVEREVDREPIAIAPPAGRAQRADDLIAVGGLRRTADVPIEEHRVREVRARRAIAAAAARSRDDEQRASHFEAPRRM